MTGIQADIARRQESPEFARLKEIVITATGLAFLGAAGNDSSLRRALDIRMRATGLSSAVEYIAEIEIARNSEELQSLIDEVTIGETHFFRDDGMFKSLTDIVLPQIVERNGATRDIRLWSAGCSTGAEPYSIAILIKRLFPDQAAAWDIDIVGTDINRRFLRIAESGVYGGWTLRTIQTEVLPECFDPSGREYRLKDSCRLGARFMRHNLIADPIPFVDAGLANLDVIVCRNVAIYFDGKTMAELLVKFHRALRPGGWLILGHAEVMPNVIDPLDIFEFVNTPGGTIYRKYAPDIPRRKRADGLGKVLKAPNSANDTATEPLSAAQRLSETLRTRAIRPTESRLAPASRPGPGMAKSGAAGGSGGGTHGFPPEAPIRQDEMFAEVRSLIDRGCWSDAADAARALLDADPTSGEAYRLQGIAMAQLNRFEEAESSFRRAVYLDRRDIMAHYFLATLLREAGRRDEALRELRSVGKKLGAHSPNDPVSREASVTAGELQSLISLWTEDGSANGGGQ